MPRLSQSNFILQHQLLRKEWLDRHGFAFTMLSPIEQILVHDFYEPSKSFTDSQLRAHRAAITKHRPSLPHLVGKAFAHIKPFLNVIPTPSPAPARGEPYVAKITSLVNPHIDPARMAQILLAVASESHDRVA